MILEEKLLRKKKPNQISQEKGANSSVSSFKATLHLLNRKHMAFFCIKDSNTYESQDYW